MRIPLFILEPVDSLQKIAVTYPVSAFYLTGFRLLSCTNNLILLWLLGVAASLNIRQEFARILLLLPTLMVVSALDSGQIFYKKISSTSSKSHNCKAFKDYFQRLLLINFFVALIAFVWVFYLPGSRNLSDAFSIVILFSSLTFADEHQRFIQYHNRSEVWHFYLFCRFILQLTVDLVIILFLPSLLLFSIGRLLVVFFLYGRRLRHFVLITLRQIIRGSPRAWCTPVAQLYSIVKVALPVSLGSFFERFDSIILTSVVNLDLSVYVVYSYIISIASTWIDSKYFQPIRSLLLFDLNDSISRRYRFTVLKSTIMIFFVLVILTIYSVLTGFARSHVFLCLAFGLLVNSSLSCILSEILFRSSRNRILCITNTFFILLVVLACTAPTLVHFAHFSNDVQLGSISIVAISFLVLTIIRCAVLSRYALNFRFP